MKVAVCGAGYWGANYIRELGRHCVLAVEPCEEQAKEIAKRFGVRVVPEFPEDADVDGVIVATPPKFHAPIALEHLAKGRYVLVEKPFTLCVDDARKLAEYPRCMAAHVYLWHPKVVELRAATDTLDVDHVFTRRTNAGPVRSWSDVLWDLAPHDVSICNYLAGRPPLTVTCSQTVNWATLTLDYDDWFSLSYTSWLGGPKVRLVEVVLKERAVASLDRITFDDVATVLVEQPLTLMLRDFLSGQWDDRGSGTTGLRIVEVLQDAERSVH